MLEVTRKKIIDKIKLKSLKFGEFVLANGEKSDFYIDLQSLFSVDPYILKFFAREISFILQKLDILPETIFGVSYGGIPLAVELACYLQNPYFISQPSLAFNRKEKIKHGVNPDELIIGEIRNKVLIVNDVITTGSSSLRIIDFLRENYNTNIVGIFCCVNRGKVEFVSGIPVINLFEIEEILQQG